MATLIMPLSVASSMLMGISSISGIHSIRNCPGLALALCLSLKVKVLTDGLSVTTLFMVVTRKLLAFVN
jgi:hypothetical protein